MSIIFIEENNVYQIDLTNANNAIGNLKEKYKSIGNFLSDVDFIAETEDDIFLIEYKNTEIENANNPQAFYEKISNGEIYDKILNKYYGSAFYTLSTGKNKKINYIVVLECKKTDSVVRKKIKTSVAKRLPYILQKDNDIMVNLISNFDVLSIDEWNKHKEYSKFPLSKVSGDE